MKALIIEDNDEKYELVKSEIEKLYPDNAVTIARADTLQRATKEIYETKFDFLLVDLMMPLRDGEQPQDITEDIISIIETSELNRGAGVIALTGYEELLVEQRVRFAEAGIILVHYEPEISAWRKHIQNALSRVRDHVAFDFVIFCALEKERTAYRATSAQLGSLRNIRGLDCWALQISGLRGACIKLPRMGLVDASVTASRAIERFNPRLVAMSGICAGASEDVAVGSLVVADICWEYQAGKWADDQFKMEHYDIGLDNFTRTNIGQLIAKDPRGDVWKKDLPNDPVVLQEIIIAPMTTGSAVIASEERVGQIKDQHRKVAAIDMEMYGIYRAAELSATRPLCFGVKTVVDMADNAKGDHYHEYGCILSARFVLAAIEHLLLERNQN